MLNKIKSTTYTSWPYIIFIVLSLIMMSTSFLYQISAFCDINTMLAMGKSVVHGVIPFVDIFEQRGPYMYLLHTIAILPGDGIHWVYILELIIFYWIYRIMIKIVELNPNIHHNKSRFYAVTVTSIFLFSPSLGYGASPEEFCFVPAIYTLYVLLKNITIAKSKAQTIYVPQKEILLIGLGLGWTIMVKFATIGTICGFFIAYGLYLLFNKKIKNFIITVGTALLGTTISVLPVFIYQLYFGNIKEFLYQYFVANSGMSAYSISTALPKFIKILGMDLLYNFGFLLIIAIPMIIGFLKATEFKKQKASILIISMFTIQLTMSLFIMRYAANYTSLSILFILGITMWNFPQFIKLIHISSKIQITILGIIFSTLIVIESLFANGVFLHLNDTIIYHDMKTMSKKQDASYIQGQIIKHNGGGVIESYANVPWGIYEYADNYPKLKYFDQTTIPYKSQKIAGDSQYNYIKNKSADWIQTPIFQITSSDKHIKTIDEYLKEKYVPVKKSNHTTSAESISPIIDAPIQREKEHPNQYYEYAKVNIKNTTFLMQIPPKVLMKNYVLINAHTMAQTPYITNIGQKKIKLQNGYGLFTTKENAQKHHLKAIPIKTLE